MDDFIYIILLIAWVIFAFYRKSKKNPRSVQKTDKPAMPRERSQPIPTLEDILLGREPVEEDEHEIIVAEDEYPDGKAPKLQETAFEREYNLRGISSIEEMDRQIGSVRSYMEKMGKIEVEKNLEEEPEYDHEWRDKFDLRQAVIFSEILNRPYV